ncbi:hypothetical protein [Nocardiopsis tropica]|uniref:Uncharacterized protein n=1 Tax=Nocardiopsis tropica TaxID=109330 RepID=A0ABU7KLZ4_9ACTN|nr:hypothetical protein [Nocardiopsis umidischolae]MEE2050313.1 hypothetical protein [Nocardiopsis umidischolae]
MTSTTPTPLPTHPTTGLRALGMTRRGPIWPVLGGDETGSGGDGQGGTAGPGQTGAGGDGQGDQTGGQQTGQQGGQAPQLGPDGQPWDPARAQALIDNLRAENTRLKGKQDGQGQAPGQQQNQGQQAQQQAGQAPADDTAEQLRTANTKIAVLEHAAKHGANPTALTDSMSFMAKVAKLDPGAADYSTKLGDAIKKALADHPHYATGQAPGTSPRGGSDGTGRPGATQQPKGLGGALRAHYAKK